MPVDFSPTISPVAAQPALQVGPSAAQLKQLLNQVKQGHSFPEALTAALQAKDSTNSDVSVAAFLLLETLVLQGYAEAYPHALAIAEEGTSNENTMSLCVGLFQALIRQKQALPQAIAAVERLLEQPSTFIHNRAYDILTSLVREGQAFVQAKAIVRRDHATEELPAILKVAEALAHQGQDYPQAIVLIKRTLSSKYVRVQRLSTHLLQFLRKQDGKLEGLPSIPSAASSAQMIG